LQTVYSDFVTRQIITAAQSVGAPNNGLGKKCGTNIEIVFTPTPQELLDHLAKSYPTVLGSSRSRNDRTMTRPIQAWYLTGTHSMNGWNPPVQGLNSQLFTIRTIVLLSAHEWRPIQMRTDPADHHFAGRRGR
jgi:hypothetical protein